MMVMTIYTTKMMTMMVMTMAKDDNDNDDYDDSCFLARDSDNIVLLDT